MMSPLLGTRGSNRAPAWLVTLSAIALAAAGCSGGGGDSEQTETGAAPAASDPGTDSTDSTQTTAAEAAPSGDRLSPATFDGEATTVEGASFDLAGLANKDLVVWFWAPW